MISSRLRRVDPLALLSLVLLLVGALVLGTFSAAHAAHPISADLPVSDVVPVDGDAAVTTGGGAAVVSDQLTDATIESSADARSSASPHAGLCVRDSGAICLALTAGGVASVPVLDARAPVPSSWSTVTAPVDAFPMPALAALHVPVGSEAPAFSVLRV